MAELVKTRLLAGRRLDVRGAAAYKAGICVQDPHDHGPRRWLNLGHTFAHGLEAGGRLRPAARRGGGARAARGAPTLGAGHRPRSSRSSRPARCSVDPERAWQALLRDKKRSGDAINLVLLGDDGPYVEPRPADEVRRELERLIA